MKGAIHEIKNQNRWIRTNKSVGNPNIEVDLYSGNIRVRGVKHAGLGNIKEYMAEAITPKEFEQMVQEAAQKTLARDVTATLEGKRLPPDEDPFKGWPEIVEPDE